MEFSFYGHAFLIISVCFFFMTVELHWNLFVRFVCVNFDDMGYGMQKR